MQKLRDDIRKAYKKLKADIYFNKTVSHMREDLLAFEGENNVEEKLDKLASDLNAGEESWEETIKDILGSIKLYAYPKKVKRSADPGKNLIICRSSEEDELIIDDTKDIQWMIGLDIRGHILGVLWVLYIGREIDANFYKHSYGNRLLNKEKQSITASPYLFKPYFREYESWRDKALQEARKQHEEDKNSIIFMLDIKRFYYSLNFTEEIMKRILEDAKINNNSEVSKRINQFIFKVMETYSLQYHHVLDDKNKNILLPIGFLPSNVLANWYLDKLDNNIVDRINPAYYGRYVDDIIIVDKVEDNSELYTKFVQDKFNELINLYFIDKKNILTTREEEKQLIPQQDQVENQVYRIVFDENDERHKAGTKLEIQYGKFKVIYLPKEGTTAILDKFAERIKHNSSEFRLLPDSGSIMYEHMAIYNLVQGDSINKLRGIDDFGISKYELSKFIGKRVFLENSIKDKRVKEFYYDIKKIYDQQVILNNYTTWENLFNLCIVNNDLIYFEQIYKMIKNAISSLQVNICSKQDINVKDTLNKHLNSCAIRALSMVWGEGVRNLLKKIGFSTIQIDNISLRRKQYIETYMSNQALISLPINTYIRDGKCLLDDDHTRNINRLEVGLKVADEQVNEEFIDDIHKILEVGFSSNKYYPYMIKFEDMFKYIALIQMIKEKPVKIVEKEIEQVNIRYSEANFGIKNNKFQVDSRRDSNEDSKEYEVSEQVKSFIFNKPEQEDSNVCRKANIISIGKEVKDEIRIAIANANVYEEDFKSVMLDKPNRSYKRYESLKNIINQAVKNEADLIVLPENYVPFEWIHLLEREARSANIAIIAGIEHIKYKKKMHNLIVSIFPYQEGEYTYLYTNLRSKVFYSPEEKRQIRGHWLEPVEGKEYNLFVWNNVWIPVYCCYEMTSIQDRSIFYNLIDLYTIVEWNKDINYFSNIIESLSRDMHCYCVQVNSSNYGDSCIITPSKTEQKNIVRTKGGENDTILIGRVNLKKLREFQLTSYELQKDNKDFKATPPGYNPELVDKKIKKKLFDYLYKKNKK